MAATKLRAHARTSHSRTRARIGFMRVACSALSIKMAWRSASAVWWTL
jgi:hypothetical protein